MTSQIANNVFLSPEVIPNPFGDSNGDEGLFTGRSITYINPDIERPQQFWENVKIAKELIIEVQKIIPVSQNFLQRSKEYFSALNWPQYAFYSNTGQAIPLSIDTPFLKNWPDFTDHSPYPSVISFKKQLSKNNNSKPIDLAYSLISMANEDKEILRAGNCGIMADTAVIIGNRRCRIECIFIRGGDHGACVIGRDPNSSKDDYTTWGENAVICDPWSPACYAATEIPSQLFNYKRTSEDGRHPVVERYDSLKHHVIVSAIQPTETLIACFQLAYLSGQTQHIQPLLDLIVSDDIEKLFVNAARTQQPEILNIIVHSERFKDISPESLTEALSFLNTTQKLKIVNDIIN